MRQILKTAYCTVRYRFALVLAVDRNEQAYCFNYLNLSRVASAASGSSPSLWMKLAHLAYLTFVH
jgi:hypothetical protein